MRDILHYLWRMTPAVIIGLVVFLCVRPVRLRRLRRRGCYTTAGHEAALAVLFMFLAGLLWLTVLPEVLVEDGRIVLREEGFGEINLQPFIIFKQARILAQQGVKNYFLINFWGNILMFVPVGLLPALLWRGDRWWKALLSGFGLSLAIELCQIPISRGTDIDDLWLNTLGAMAGYWTAWLAGRAWPRFVERFRVTEGRRWK